MTVNKNESSLGSFTEPAFTHFPPLPHSPYVPTQTERLVRHITYKPYEDSATVVLDRLVQLSWVLVLAAHTNSNDIVFGMAHHGRYTETGQQAIMPFHFKVQPDMSVADALVGIASYEDRIRQFEHLGLEKYSTLGLEHNAMCQFRNLLVIHNQGECEPLPRFSYTRSYPLSVCCEWQAGNALRLVADVDPLVVHPDTMTMMLSNFTDIFTACISDEDSMVQDVQAVGVQGWAHLLQWNGRRARTRMENLHADQLIEERCRTAPSATAVDAWDGTVTYGELDHWASRIAQRLVNLGIIPGSFVGLLMPKSVLAPVTMIAVIKAGGAFLMLPPSMPELRLRTMCHKAKVEVILSHSSVLKMAKALGPLVVELANDMGQTLDADGRQFHLVATKPHHPLYAIFTSGSTGDPKGVVVDRGSFGRGIPGFCERTRLGPDTRIFQTLSYAFIVSVAEQLMALAAGACICIPSEGQLQNDMESAMDGLTANWSMLTPSLARVLDPRRLPSLQHLFLTGEPFSPDDVLRWEGRVMLYVLYGQTEACNSVLVKQLTSSCSESYGLGYITTGACWVVDPQDHSRLRPIGAEGELLIESPALATGYIDDDEQTAAVFVERPLWLQKMRSSHDCGRCLRTGDLVRYQDLTGSIQFCGRKGRQTKIRGQRVELGEVESALRAQFPEAAHVIVDVLLSASGQDQQSTILVGFIHDARFQKPASPQGLVHTTILASPTTVYRAKVRQAASALRKMLPAYMIPSAILPICVVPKTATGKISRNALLEAVSQLSVSEIMSYNDERVAYRAPSTPKERLLQSICESLLRLPASSVSVDDNFFHIGGDSLTARRLSSMAREQGLLFTVTDVFDQATLALLAQASHLSCATGTDDIALALATDPFEKYKTQFIRTLPTSLAPEDIEDVYPANEMQRIFLGYKFIDQYPFELTGEVDTHQLQRACESLLERLPVLRSIFIPFDHEIMQVILRRVNTPFTKILLPAGEDLKTWLESYGQEELQNKPPMDQPGVKFTLIQGSPQRSILLLRLPHALYDGGCLKQISEHLSAEYNRQPLPIECHFSAYRRHCARLRTSEAFAFWRDLMGGSEITRLPRASAGRDEPVIYSAECSPASPPSGITMATAIKAAWSYVLRRITGRSDVLFGQMGSCRGVGLPGDQDIVGMCLNTTPVRVSYVGLETVNDLFEAIQRQYARVLEFETIDWVDIVANSTEWPEGTDLDSVVLHENLGNIPALQLGGATGWPGQPIFTTPAWKRHMLLTWPGNQKLTTFLMGRQNALDKQFAETLVKDFNSTLVQFLDSPHTLLRSFDSPGGY